MALKENKVIVKFLSKVSFFSEVSEESLENLCDDLSIEVFNKGALVFSKGDLGADMFVVFSGVVRVFEENHVYGRLESGDCFGEYALIDNEARSASVLAEEITEVYRIGRNQFLNLMAKDSGFAQGILAVMIKRHRELDTIQEHLATSKKELELSSSKMSGLITGAMDAIIMFKQDFRIVLTNPAAIKLLENDDVLQRNVLFFLDEKSADELESLVLNKSNSNQDNKYISQIIKVIGSSNTETLNEGTISWYGSDDAIFYTLILRNIEDRLIAEDKINYLTKETEYLKDELKELTSNHGIIAEDVSMKNTLNLINQVAKTNATVLVTGETGTGKELVARAIHQSSERSDQSLIRINCGAIPANLIESELFGHKKGSFTGATEDRKGRFLLADKGTIFLDEIGEMPIDLQPKLLRVIQEGEFDPVGSSKTEKVNVRIIAATHRDLLKHAQEGKFREDLYYRLNVFPIQVPALRNRGADVCLIAEEMIQHFSIEINKPISKLTKPDKALLKAYSWPGNVRELQNLIERAVIISNNGKINWSTIIPNESNLPLKNSEPAVDKIYTSKELVTLEKENILKALKQTRWRISGVHGAAELLQLKPTTLASKIKALGIERPI